LGEREFGEQEVGEREVGEREVGERVFGKQEVREREKRESGDFDGRVRVPCTKGNNGTHRTLDSAVDFGPEDVPHLSSWTARLRCTWHRRISRTAPRHWTPWV